MRRLGSPSVADRERRSGPESDVVVHFPRRGEHHVVLLGEQVANESRERGRESRLGPRHHEYQPQLGRAAFAPPPAVVRRKAGFVCREHGRIRQSRKARRRRALATTLKEDRGSPPLHRSAIAGCRTRIMHAGCDRHAGRIVKEG